MESKKTEGKWDGFLSHLLDIVEDKLQTTKKESRRYEMLTRVKKILEEYIG